jgi:hypothetical protein
MAKFMAHSEYGYDILTSYFIKQIDNLEPFGTYEVVNEEYKPWLVSYRIYGDVQYWWILMMYNKIISHYDVKIGIEINYPSIEDIEDVYFNLKSKQMGKGL